MVLFFTPLVVAVTFTVIVQLAPRGSVSPVRPVVLFLATALVPRCNL
jgi:hypothetical protein